MVILSLGYFRPGVRGILWTSPTRIGIEPNLNDPRIKKPHSTSQPFREVSTGG